MTDVVVRATPRSVAIAGAAPFALAFLAVGHPALFAAGVGAGVAMFYGWSWVVGHALNRRIEAAQRPPVGAFRLCIGFCALYVAAFLIASSGAVATSHAHQPALFFALHFAAMLATIGIVRFIATNLALAEAAADIEPGTPSTTALALFSIAGVLPVQRRINRLFGAT